MRHAKESKFIKRLRRKIRKELKQSQKKATKAKLVAMAQRIHMHLERDARTFQTLEKAAITVFDENQHAAPTKSREVKRLEQAIKNEFAKFQKKSDPQQLSDA